MVFYNKFLFPQTNFWGYLELNSLPVYLHALYVHLLLHTVCKILNKLIGVETGPTPENVKTPIKKSETTKSSVIQVRLCSFIVLVAVLLSTGITAVGFMTFNNTRTTDKIDHAECGKVNQEPLSDENDSISVLRSTCPIGWSRRGDSCYNLYEERKRGSKLDITA